MNAELIVHVVRECLLACLWISGPLLALGFLIGIAVNIVQVATSMQDSSFSTVPRLAAFAAGVFLLLPWMLRTLSTFTVRLFSDLTPYAR
jgi:flagellar biosynthetic protein FliQ